MAGRMNSLMKMTGNKLWQTILFCAFICLLFITRAAADDEEYSAMDIAAASDYVDNFIVPDVTGMATVDTEFNIPSPMAALDLAPGLSGYANTGINYASAPTSIPEFDTQSATNIPMYQPAANIISESQFTLGLTDPEEQRFKRGERTPIMNRVEMACGIPPINPIEQNHNLAWNSNMQPVVSAMANNVINDVAQNLPVVNVDYPVVTDATLNLVADSREEALLVQAELPTFPSYPTQSTLVVADASAGGNTGDNQRAFADRLFSGEPMAPAAAPIPDNPVSQLPAAPVLPKESRSDGLEEFEQLGITAPTTPKLVEQSPLQPVDIPMTTRVPFSETPVMAGQKEFPSASTTSLDTSSEPGFFRRAFNWVIDGIYSIGGGISSIFSGIGGIFSSGYSSSLPPSVPVYSGLGMSSNPVQTAEPSGPDSLYWDPGRLSSGAPSVYSWANQAVTATSHTVLDSTYWDPGRLPPSQLGFSDKPVEPVLDGYWQSILTPDEYERAIQELKKGI
jgi:hypothetical protein